MQARPDISSDWRRRASLVALLWSLGVAQPLFAVLSSAGEFFVEQGLVGQGTVLLALGLSVGPPCLLIAAGELLRRLWSPLGRLTYKFMVGLLVLAFGASLAVGGRQDASWGSALLATAVAIGLLLLFRVSSSLRRAVVWLAPVAVVVPPLIFLLSPGIRGLWQPVAEAEGLDGETRTPVAVLVLDELPLASLVNRQDEIDSTRYPNFASLAQTAVWFRNARSTALMTGLSMTAFLTGNLPAHEVAPTASEYPDNLFALLSSTHDLRVVERVTDLCVDPGCSSLDAASGPSGPPRRRLADLVQVYGHIVLPRPLRSSLSPIDTGWRDFGSATLATASLSPRAEPGTLVSAFFNEASRVGSPSSSPLPSDRPELLYLHLMVPHVPWKYLPEGLEYIPPEEHVLDVANRRKAGYGGDWEILQTYQRHLLQTEYADRLVGEFLAGLRRRGLFDRTMILVLSDHGASFLPETDRRAFPQDLNVPLLIKWPGQTSGRTVDTPMSLLDCLPTVLAALGLESELPFEGRVMSPDESLPSQSPAARSKVAQVRSRLVDHKYASFPELDDEGGLFKIGPHAARVGAAVDPAVGGRSTGLQATLKYPWLFDGVDRSRGLLPVYVEGDLQTEQALDGPVQIAVGVNGLLGGVTRSSGADFTHFGTMVPPELLQEGRNRVEIWRVEGAGEVWQRIPLPDERLELVMSSEPPTLEIGGGEPVPVEPHDSVRFRLGRRVRTYVVEGSIQRRRDEDAPRVFLFEAGRTLGELQEVSDAELRSDRRHYRLSLPLGQVEEANDVRVVILRGSRAFEQKVRTSG